MKYTGPAKPMKTEEKFALDEWLSDYPEGKTYEEICEMVLDEHEDIIVFGAFDGTPAYELAENIDCTMEHFKAVMQRVLSERNET